MTIRPVSLFICVFRTKPGGLQILIFHGILATGRGAIVVDTEVNRAEQRAGWQVEKGKEDALLRGHTCQTSVAMETVRAVERQSHRLTSVSREGYVNARYSFFPTYPKLSYPVTNPSPPGASAPSGPTPRRLCPPTHPTINIIVATPWSENTPPAQLDEIARAGGYITRERGKKDGWTASVPVITMET